MEPNPLLRLEAWVSHADYEYQQVGFCAQWCLDNLCEWPDGGWSGFASPGWTGYTGLGCWGTARCFQNRVLRRFCNGEVEN